MQIKNKIITITILFLSFFVFDLNIKAEEFNISAIEISVWMPIVIIFIFGAVGLIHANQK